MTAERPICEGQVLTGPLFSEPMRVETVRPDGAAIKRWIRATSMLFATGRAHDHRGAAMIPRQCKRRAEVDFPVAEVSRHALHGHPSTPHLRQARRCSANRMRELLRCKLQWIAARPSMRAWLQRVCGQESEGDPRGTLQHPESSRDYGLVSSAPKTRRSASAQSTTQESLVWCKVSQR